MCCIDDIGRMMFLKHPVKEIDKLYVMVKALFLKESYSHYAGSHFGQFISWDHISRGLDSFGLLQNLYPCCY